MFLFIEDWVLENSMLFIDVSKEFIKITNSNMPSDAILERFWS